MKCKVYVAAPLRGPVKIGRAVDTKRRLDFLNTSSPRPLEITFATEPRDDAELVERTAHKLLDAKRMNGEWFGVSRRAAEQTVRRAVEMAESGEAIRLLAAKASKREAPEPPPVSPEEFGALLRACGLRQNQLAAILGVDVGTVNRWCRQRTKDSRPIARYAVAFLTAFRELAPTGRANVLATLSA